ncbi:MAG: helix-turn-helix transcriptional regulator [Candidatus Nanopelagicales bacterium]
MTPVPQTPEAPARSWTLLTNHARVLLLIARDPDARLRDLADAAQITERAAQAIVRDLVDAGFLTRTRVGRRNTYELHPSGRFRHPAEADHEVGELLALFSRADSGS